MGSTIMAAVNRIRQTRSPHIPLLREIAQSPLKIIKAFEKVKIKLCGRRWENEAK